MLTPNQILNHSFATTRGTYKAEEVDEFIELVVESYQQMFKENGEMLNKLEILAKRIEEYREDEDNIKAALITAQKMSDRIVTESQEKADKTVADAENKAKELLSSSRAESDKLLAETKASTDKTLAEAEDTANEVIDAAKLLADNVIGQAKASSEEILGSVKDEIVIQQAILDDLKIQSTNFKSELLEIYHTNIEGINEIPALVEEEYATIKKRRMDAKNADIHNATAPQTEEPKTVEKIEEIEELSDIDEIVSVTEEQVDEPTRPVDAFDETSMEEQGYTDAKTTVMDSPTAIFDKVELNDQSDIEDVYSGDEIEEIEAPIQNDKSFKFGEDYDISEDEDDEDDNEGSQGFRGFFKRKK